MKEKYTAHLRTKKEALRMLSRLNGGIHHVITGLCVIDVESGDIVLDDADTTVKFRKVRDRTLQNYVKSGEAMGKAGAYALQGMGAALIAEVSGDVSNVVGLPLPKLLDILEKMNVDFC